MIIHRVLRNWLDARLYIHVLNGNYCRDQIMWMYVCNTAFLLIPHGFCYFLSFLLCVEACEEDTGHGRKE